MLISQVPIGIQKSCEKLPDARGESKFSSVKCVQYTEMTLHTNCLAVYILA